MSEVPLFPLRTVLFPGGPLALRVFEPRYVDMVSRVLRGANRFGVLCIRHGSEVGAAETFAVGTLAEIVDWQRGDDGLLGVRARGREAFELLERRREPDGLYVGTIRELPPEDAQPLAVEHRPLAALLRDLLPQVPGYAAETTSYDDAGWVSYRLAEILPLPLAEKQRMLEMHDAHARLERLRVSVTASGAA